MSLLQKRHSRALILISGDFNPAILSPQLHTECRLPHRRWIQHWTECCLKSETYARALLLSLLDSLRTTLSVCNQYACRCCKNNLHIRRPRKSALRRHVSSCCFKTQTEIFCAAHIRITLMVRPAVS